MSRKRGPGRPRLAAGKARGRVLSVRLTPAEREAVEKAARAAGCSPSEWARRVLTGTAA